VRASEPANGTTVFRRRGEGTTVRHALMVGGTGMLAACTSALVAEGWHVVLPSRQKNKNKYNKEEVEKI